jgi:hypothetical protein
MRAMPVPPELLPPLVEPPPSCDPDELPLLDPDDELLLVLVPLDDVDPPPELLDPPPSSVLCVPPSSVFDEFPRHAASEKSPRVATETPAFVMRFFTNPPRVR